MPRFQMQVDELRRLRREYHVEADDAESAHELAERGETIEEMDEGRYEVAERFVVPDTLVELPEYTYEIEQYELHAMTYRVRACSEAEAIERLLDGQGEPVEGTLDYIEVAEDRGLSADDHVELCAQLRELGISVKAGVVPSIRSIRVLAAPRSGTDAPVIANNTNDDALIAETQSPLAEDAASLFRVDCPVFESSPQRSQLVRARSPREAVEVAMDLWNESSSPAADGSVLVVSPLGEPEGGVGAILEPAGQGTGWQVQNGRVVPASQTYRVRYEIDVDAEDPLAAARQSYAYMISPESYRPVLEVALHQRTGEVDFCTAEAFDLHELGCRDDMARQLELVADIIESTYPHDADGGRVEGDSPISGADVVERLAALEEPIRDLLHRHAPEGPTERKFHD